MSYSFPKLKYQEIVTCLREQGITLTVQDLQEPDEEKIRPVYEKLVENLINMTKDDMRQPEFRAIDALQNPELHEDSLGEVAMTKQILVLFRAAGLKSCTIRDINFPTAQNTKKILSAIINFSKFRYERQATFQRYTDETDEIMKVVDQQEQENIELLSNVKELRAQHERDAPVILKLQQETKALENQISEMHKEQKRIEKGNKDIKAATQEKNELFEKDKIRLLQVQQECARLRQQVVRSPKKLRDQLRNMHNAVETEKEEVAICGQRLIEMKNKHQALSTFHETVLKRLEGLAECEAQLQVSKKQIVETREAVLAAEQDKRMSQQLALEERQLKEQIATVTNKLNALTINYQKQSTAAQAALDQVLEQKRALEATLAQDQEQLDCNNTQLAAKQKLLEELQFGFAQDRDELLSKQRNLADKLAAYHRALLARLRLAR
jgi:kinetochore protein Nuf2